MNPLMPTAEITVPAGTAPARRTLRRPLVSAAAALLVASAGLAIIVATKGAQFSTAFASVSPAILAIAVGIELLWIIARVKAWAVCIDAAGGSVKQRTLFRSASLGYLGNLLNPQVGLAVRIAALRRAAPIDAPRASVLATAELPIVIVEAGLAAILSFTLVGALHLSWWIPVAALAVAATLTVLTLRLAANHRRRVWDGLAVLTGSRSRALIVGLVMIATGLQVLRNFFVLHALGADITLFDSIALLIGMAALGLLPVGPGLGAASGVLILGSHGVATMAAAGALLTLTAAVGAAIFALLAWLDVPRAPVPAPAAPVA